MIRLKRSFLSYNREPSKGVALISVMLIVALCSIIASQMTIRLQTQMQRSTNISFNQQAYWYAMGAESFAKRVLLTAFKDEPDVTHLEQIWAAAETSYPIDFGEISGEIKDLQACLNLNALHPSARSKESTSSGAPAEAEEKDEDESDDEGSSEDEEPKQSTGNLNTSKTTDAEKLPAATVLESLLINLNLDGVGPFEAEAMVNALTDWLDSNSRITGTGGAEDSDYESREFPYLAANSFLASVSELRLIEHFTPAVISSITPYVCVLPQDSRNIININTLDVEQAELLQSLLGASLDEAQELLSARDSAGYTNIEDFYQLPEFTALNIEDWQRGQFAVDSEYFTMKTNARFNNSYFSMRSIMKIQKNNKIQVISRTIGRN